MSEITLIRHAQASFGAADYDRLSHLGHQQATWLGDYFAAQGWSVDRVAHGSLRRHRETYEGLAKGVQLPDPIEDPRLDELHYAALERSYIRATGSDAATSRTEFLTYFPAMFEAWSTGSLADVPETYTAFRARTLEALTALEGPGHTVIVTSGGVIGTVLASVLGLGPERTADLMLNIHNASVHRIRRENGALRLALYNAAPHLDHVDRAHARTYV